MTGGWLLRFGVCVATGLVACVENPLVICDNGRACPVGFVCDGAHDACVLPSQFAACAGKDDGTRCSFPGAATGTCASGVCIAAGCGGGVVDATEECDDGNRVNGDGCSADCLLERCGNGRLDFAESCDDGDLLSHDGCASNCTPELPNWQQLTLGSPGYRIYPAVAHDPLRQSTVLFGGSGVALAKDTWEWRDQTWSSLATLAGPGRRLAASTTYDAARRELVLFGGLVNGTTLVNDTWVYDGLRWQDLVPAASPPPRNRGALAYDAARKRVVLFGGFNTGSLGDTWEWDGTTWTELTPTTSPPNRTATAFAYDPAHGVTMMVGGLDDQSVVGNATWTWDGTTWTRLTTATTPTGLASAMAFDVARGRMALLMDVTSTTAWWEWDGTNWVPDPTRNLMNLDDGSVLFFDQATDRLTLFALTAGTQLAMLELGASGWVAKPAPSEPPARTDTAMTYDADLGRVVVFGGRDASTLLDDLWTWTGVRWAAVAPSGPWPAPRELHSMAFDAARGEVLVVGGRTGAGRTGETWAWNGTSWRLAGAMPPHQEMSLAYDARRERVIGFGGIALGFDGFDHHVAETWEWNGVTWSEIALGGGPPARSNHTMTYDARRDRIVLFGGANEYQAFNDVWEFDGTTWQQRTSAVVPQTRSKHAMAYDANRATTVIMGGDGAAIDGTPPLGDTWEWDGTTWTPIATFASPPRGSGRVAAFHPGSARVVVFGGGLGETWLYGYDGDVASEVCGGGQDVDQDGLVGCDDPDCWWRCTSGCPPQTSCDAATPQCGDGTCAPLETCRLCPTDCGACTPRCGDLVCDAGETGCPGDCTP